MGGRLEMEEFSSPVGCGATLSDSELSTHDSADEDLCSEAGSQTKLQFRCVVLKACWNDEMGMAEIMNHKGNLLKSLGINRSGKIYLSIEETLFLVQIGALLLVDEKNTTISLREIYSKVAEEKCGCSWEGFKVYEHLRSLGYIVGRLGIPWSLKSSRSCSNNNKAQNIVDSTFIAESFKDLQPNEVKLLCEDYLPNKLKKMSREESEFVVHLPVYEVYLPNSQFKKTCPGDPNFVVYSASGNPPSVFDIKELERQSNGLPLKIGHVDDGRVSLFSFDRVDLPALP
ncbi:putative tRNA-splicing endonuclease subunit sen54 [Bienertia sinuspersici]